MEESLELECFKSNFVDLLTRQPGHQILYLFKHVQVILHYETRPVRLPTIPNFLSFKNTSPEENEIILGPRVYLNFLDCCLYRLPYFSIFFAAWLLISLYAVLLN